MFYETSNVANYADDNSPYSCNKDIESVILQLESDSKILLNWVSQNGLKANPDKFHLILSEPSTEYSIQIENFIIPNSKSKKLLGILLSTINLRLTNMLALCVIKHLRNYMLYLE